jgi:hypothetical protein
MSKKWSTNRATAMSQHSVTTTLKPSMVAEIMSGRSWISVDFMLSVPRSFEAAHYDNEPSKIGIDHLYDGQLHCE